MPELWGWLEEGRTPLPQSDEEQRKISMIDWLVSHHLLGAFEAGIIGLREVWLLTGDYKILKNGFPDVEADLPDDVKADLTIQRFIATAAACPQFKGIVADNTVTFLREFEGFYINLGEDENEW